MNKKITIASAKTPKDLKAAYEKVKTDAKGYGFTAVAALKEDVVSAAMTKAKQGADFVVEVEDKGKLIIAQLVCDVKNSSRSVIGRREIKTVQEYQQAVSLAKVQAFNEIRKTAFGV
jgi:hypothetical protein